MVKRTVITITLYSLHLNPLDVLRILRFKAWKVLLPSLIAFIYAILTFRYIFGSLKYIIHWLLCVLLDSISQCIHGSQELNNRVMVVDFILFAKFLDGGESFNFFRDSFNTWHILISSLPNTACTGTSASIDMASPKFDWFSWQLFRGLVGARLVATLVVIVLSRQDSILSAEDSGPVLELCPSSETRKS